MLGQRADFPGSFHIGNPFCRVAFHNVGARMMATKKGAFNFLERPNLALRPFDQCKIGITIQLFMEQALIGPQIQDAILYHRCINTSYHPFVVPVYLYG